MTCLVKNQSGENGSSTVSLDVQDDCNCSIRHVNITTESESSECFEIIANVTQDKNQDPIIFTLLTNSYDQEQFYW